MSSGRPSLVLVAALARGRVIGRNGDMPWHLPADLAHFKALTLGHPVLMGRRTYESIGRPLPGRLNIVISRGRPELPAGVERAASLADGLALAPDAEKIMVIGGGQIYAEALPMADQLELTLIDAAIDGDTYFPEFQHENWRLSALQARPADERNAYALHFIRLARRRVAEAA
ncbi:MAG: type 3 dihydrofolate reductase [Wenzhouxiangella sp.]